MDVDHLSDDANNIHNKIPESSIKAPSHSEIKPEEEEKKGSKHSSANDLTAKQQPLQTRTVNLKLGLSQEKAVSQQNAEPKKAVINKPGEAEDAKFTLKKDTSKSSLKPAGNPASKNKENNALPVTREIKLETVSSPQPSIQKKLNQVSIGNTMSHVMALPGFSTEDLEQCTFHPQLIQQNENKRSVNKFLEDQNAFLLNVEHKKEKIRNKLVQQQNLAEGTYKPKICKKSIQILENKKKKASAKEDTHNRLYKESTKNPQQRQMLDMAKNDGFSSAGSNASSLFIGYLTGISYQLGVTDKEATFMPNIQKKSRNLKREDKVDNILYNDAMRRQHKSVEFKKKRKQTSSVCQMSEGSKKALASRFIKEFDMVVIEFLTPEKEPVLDYLQVNGFLRKLCFLKDSETVELPLFTPERILLHEMWICLCGEQNKGVHRRNLLVFLLAVMGLYFQITKIQKWESGGDQLQESIEFKPNTINPASGQTKTASQVIPSSKKLQADEEQLSGSIEQHLDSKNGLDSKLFREFKPVGTFDSEGNYEITPEEVNKIKKNFSLWYVNRMGSPDSIGQLVTNRNFEDHSYRPELCERSRNIAHLYREKILENTTELIQANKMVAPKDGKITHADLLVLSKKVAKEKLDQTRQTLESQELRGCTFKPLTNDFTQTSRILGKSTTRSQLDGGDNEADKIGSVMSPSSLGRNRGFELYSLNKPRIEKKDKAPADIEYEKNCDECTFQPTLTHKRQKSATGGPVNIIAKNIEKTIERMRTAQSMREQRLLESQRGYNPTLEDPSLKFTVDKSNGILNKSIAAATKDPRSKDLTSRTMGGETSRERSGNQSRRRARNKTSETQPHSARQMHQIENDLPEESAYQNIGQRQRKDGEGEIGADEEGEEEQVPLLFVDVNLGQGKTERIVVHEGDDSASLAKKFAEEHGLDDVMTGKLKELLDSQIAGLLTRIDEEMHSLQSEADQ